jgi:tetratricopeptide (TPR) repeat protein
MTRLADGEAAVTKALKLAPNHPAAHFVMGLLLVYSGRAGQGVSELERALALDRNLAAAYFGLASAKAFTGAAEAAEAPLLEALRLSPRDANVFVWLHLLGVIKQFLRADEEATIWYRRSIEANRSFPLPHFLLASALAHVVASTRRAPRWRSATRSTRVSRSAGSTALRRASIRHNLAQREHIAHGMRLAGVPEG